MAVGSFLVKILGVDLAHRDTHGDSEAVRK
jgi:hypothetical protein